jgi:putative ATPase
MDNNRFTYILKPNTLEEFVGQKHIISLDKPLYKLIKKKDIPHLFFYGKPGTGKTSLAKIIAKEIDTDFYNFNATTLKIDDLRKVFNRYENSLIKPLVFIDEVHRLSKNQQEVLLPVMENFSAIIIGASTESPYHSLTAAIRSRSFIYEFETHDEKDMHKVLERLENEFNIRLLDEVKEYLIKTSNGDIRAMLNLLEYGYKVDTTVPLNVLVELRQKVQKDGMSSADSHYDLASAMIKSIRGSDIDASLYYLARLIDGAEDIDFITRRLVISASEDIGNANPNALNLAVSVQSASKQIGYPEARILMAQCVVYLASSPKSNSSYMAINKALHEIQNGTILKIPDNIIDKAIGYKYPHDFGGWCEQTYLTKKKKFYNTQKIGYEKTLNEWVEKIKSIKE